MDMLDRGYSCLEIKATNEEQRIIEGIATTPKVDRVGDVVEPLGLTFAKSVPLLLFHDSTKPVGEVRFGKATKAGLPFTAYLPKVMEEGRVRDRVEEAWQSIKYKLIGAVSIGFRHLEDGIERIATGYRYTKTEILELSLVPVPAQDEAIITSFKSMDAMAIASIKATLAKLDADKELLLDPAPAATGNQVRVVKLNPGPRQGQPFVIRKINR